MRNLENYGVQSLNAKEIRETEGGFFFGFIPPWMELWGGINIAGLSSYALVDGGKVYES